MAKRLPKGCEDALHFESVEALRAWFDAHHASATEMWLLHYKAHTGKRTISWSQSVDEALAVGWIDSVIQPLDADRYAKRFSPRKPGSIWSAINVKKAEVLIADGRMRPAGLKAFEARLAARTGTYTHEQGDIGFEPAEEKAFRAMKKAWAFFDAQPRSYRRAATWWVRSARRDATRKARLAALIAHSADGERLPQFRPRTPPRSAAASRRGSRPPSGSRSSS
jgi:uncharacterized protein YdeI (YjbR/CyaY-like superfamily)